MRNVILALISWEYYKVCLEWGEICLLFLTLSSIMYIDNTTTTTTTTTAAATILLLLYSFPVTVKSSTYLADSANYKTHTKRKMQRGKCPWAVSYCTFWGRQAAAWENGSVGDEQKGGGSLFLWVFSQPVNPCEAFQERCLNKIWQVSLVGPTCAAL